MHELVVGIRFPVHEDVQCHCGWSYAILRPGGNENSGWIGCINPDCEYGCHRGLAYHVATKIATGNPKRPRVLKHAIASLSGQVLEDITTALKKIGIEMPA